jgi:3-oxoadipate enol-lactonase
MTSQTMGRMSVVVRDGTSISYLVRGTSDRRRVALVHSLALDGEIWRPVADRLAERASVLTIDCRGQGTSDAPLGPYSVGQFADDLADVMDAAGWQSAVIAGASMGGCVAISFTARYSSRSAALGLFDTTAWYGTDAPRRREERAVHGVAAGVASLVEFQKTRWFSDALERKIPT